MKRIALSVAAAFILITGQVAAEGVSPPSRIKAPGVTLAPAWGGAYVGAGIGAGVLSYDISGEAEKTKKVKNTSQVKTGECARWDYFCGIFTCKEWKYVSKDYYVEETYTESFRDSGTGDVGIFGTVTVGYDHMLHPGWVVGVFADYDFGSQISANFSIPGYSGSIDHNYSWAVGGRLGFLVTSSTLLYGTAGYTQASFDIGPFGSKTFGGYFAGAGVETLLSQSWSLKLEYRYSDFGSETFSDGPVTFDLDLSMHTARAVLSYKLGRD